MEFLNSAYGEDGSPIERISDWEYLGILSFARYYDITTEEALTMINNPNETFYDMMEEMKQSMLRYENFMVKIRRVEEEGESWSRLDFLDFSE